MFWKFYFYLEPPDPSITPVTTEDSIPVTPNGNYSTANSTGSLSEDSRDSTLSLTNNQPPRLRGVSQRGRPRGSRSAWRGRGAYSKLDSVTRRRSRLKEVKHISLFYIIILLKFLYPNPQIWESFSKLSNVMFKSCFYMNIKFLETLNMICLNTA